MKKSEKYVYAILTGIALCFATNYTGAIRGSLIAFGIIMFCAFLDIVISTRK